LKEDTSSDDLDEIARQWKALENLIPAVRRIDVGPDLDQWPENYDIAALIYFDSADGYAEYREDQAHIDFAETYLIPFVKDLEMRASVQFELPMSVSK
jgi:hypothetical protein